MMFKTIYKLGQKLRNPSIDNIFSSLKKSETWSLEELEKYQLNKLKELLEFSNTNSKFYKNLWAKNNIDVSKISTLNDFLKLPVVTKTDLLNNVDSITSTEKFEKLFKVSTSGSSGESLEFFREEHSDSFNRASIFRGYSWFQVFPWERNGYFWGFSFSPIKKIKTQILDSLQNRFRLFSYEINDMNSFLKKLEKANYLHGYSSMIYHVARTINEKKVKPSFKLKMIKGTSEKIFEHYQQEVMKAFGSRIISEYGSAETGIIAFECPHGKMHLNMEGVIVEEVDDEIVVTNLQLKNFPIIRYKLGDYIKLADKNTTCNCGMKHLILEEVTGRVGQNIFGKKGVYPSLYLYYIFKNLSKEKNILLNYQVVQNTKGVLEFRISENLNNDQLALLKLEIKKYFSEDMDNYILDNYDFKERKKEKIKNFISKINE